MKFNIKSLPYELRQASWDLYNICSGITGIHNKSQVPEDHTPILLQTGKAKSPKDAGKCLQDYARTVMFMRGIFEGILEPTEMPAHIHSIHCDINEGNSPDPANRYLALDPLGTAHYGSPQMVLHHC